MALAAGLATCLTVSAQDGTTAYNFLGVTPSSHVYGLGGHNLTIIDDDIQLVEQNPALLGPEIDHQASFSYMRYLGSSNFMGVRYGQGINEHSAWSVGLQYYGYGSFEGYDNTGVYTGDFSANDMAINLTYSHDISEYWRGGITAKFIHSKYEQYSAAAMGVDLGVNYYNPNNEFSFSVVAKNLGGQVKKFNDKSNSMPWDIQMGFTKLLNAPFRISATLYNLRRWKLPYLAPQDKNSTTSPLVEKESFGSNLMRHIVLGVEFVPNDRMYVGIGYNYKTRTDMSNYQRNLLSGFSIGAGLKVKAFGVGIAMAQPHSGASTFMFNLTTSIGELLR